MVPTMMKATKKKKLHKKTTVTRESLLFRMASVHSTLWQHPPKLWHQQLKPTLTSMFSSWMKVTLMTLQEMHMSRSLLCDYKSACKEVFFSVLDGMRHGSCIDSGDCCSQGTVAH
jgi:hypothetical protein